MIITPVPTVPRALRESRGSKPSPEVLLTTAAWLPWVSSLRVELIGHSAGRRPIYDREQIDRESPIKIA
jgi:hypothetical protein